MHMAKHAINRCSLWCSLQHVSLKPAYCAWLSGTRTDQLVFVAIDTGTSAISVKRQTGTGQPVEKVGNSPDSFRDTGHCLQPGENKAAMQGLMFTWK
eukprot:scaffold14253_cov18-Tisochrysis_lutea.AAC.1